jgi:hypothetical protein
MRETPQMGVFQQPAGKQEMRRNLTIITLISLSLLGFGLLSQITPSGYTRIELTEEGRGEKILSVVAPDGEPVTLTWRNSQFGLRVTEVFYARAGLLIQDQVTFSDPGGPPPPRVSAHDVDDLYHTGGAFDARGLSRPFSRIVYRIGEIGDPRIHVKNRTAALKKAAGFGGRMILTTARPKLYEILFCKSAETFYLALDKLRY